MKAILTFDDGNRMPGVDIYYDGDEPITMSQLERYFIQEFNRNTPHGGHRVIKVKIFRTGDMRTPREIREQLQGCNIGMNGKPLTPPMRTKRHKPEPKLNPWGEEVKQALTQSRTKKQTFKIW